jgi:hypothetical protein
MLVEMCGFAPYKTREEVIPISEMETDYPRTDGGPSLLRDLELHRSPSLPLNDHRTIADSAEERDVSDGDGDQVAASKLAVDGKIEECQVPCCVRHLQPCSNAPDLMRLERRLLTNKVVSVPGHGSSPMPPSAATALAMSLQNFTARSRAASKDLTRLPSTSSRREVEDSTFALRQKLTIPALLQSRLSPCD